MVKPIFLMFKAIMGSIQLGVVCLLLALTIYPNQMLSNKIFDTSQTIAVEQQAEFGSRFAFETNPMNLNHLAKNYKLLIADVEPFDTPKKVEPEKPLQQIAQVNVKQMPHRPLPVQLYRSLAKKQPRVALVVGNSSYLQVPSLKNPFSDSTMVARELKKLDFEVELVQNVTRLDMEKAIRRFVQSIPKDAVALFYYAGHGVQITGDNLLIPVDARLADHKNLDFDVIDLNAIVKEMQLSQSRLNLLIIDACRDNPWRDIYFQKQTKSNWLDYRSVKAQISQKRGYLSRNIQSAKGTIIAFATAENQIAADGEGNHSPYTEALIKWLAKPNIEIGRMFREIRQDVQLSTNGQQIPWERGSITGEFYFNKSGQLAANNNAPILSTQPIYPSRPLPKTEEPKVPIEPDVKETDVSNKNDVILQKPKSQEEIAEEKKQVDLEALKQENAIWEAIQTLKDPEIRKKGLEQYVNDYPNGQYKVIAELQIQDLANKESSKGEGKAPDGITPIGDGTTPPGSGSPGIGKEEPADTKVIQKASSAYDKETKVQIQESLAALKFYRGEIDGEFGPITYGAIYAFQQSRGFQPTGYLTPKELVILFADAATTIKKDPKIEQKLKKENGPTWFVAATAEGKLAYVFGMLGDPEKTTVEGSEAEKKIPSTTDKGGIALITAAKQANGGKAIMKAVLDRPDLNSFSSDPPPAPSLPGTVSYRVVLNSIVYARPAKYEKELGYLLPGSWVYVTGAVINEDWYQVKSPTGEVGYVESFALAPQPHLVHPYSLDKKNPEFEKPLRLRQKNYPGKE